jgi:hypothetical protein
VVVVGAVVGLVVLLGVQGCATVDEVPAGCEAEADELALPAVLVLGELAVLVLPMLLLLEGVQG